MSVYTTEVRYICEHYAGYDVSQDYDNVEEVIAKSRDKIFDFDFPIFDEDYRSVLETKILKHYYTREIGLETVGLWKLKLNTKMNEIMPYYNKLYKSELIDFNPLYDVDYTRDYKRENSGEGEGSYGGSSETSSENENTNWNLVQDTPQNGLTDVEEMNYLSAASKNTDNGSNSGSSSYSSEYSNTASGLEDYIEHVKGSHSGLSFSKKLEDFRRTFLNIDMQIIDELKDLFMYLW